MRYEQFPPSAGLAPIVERYWLLEGAPDEIGAEPILPDGHPEIIVHAGDPFVEVDAGGVGRPQARVLFAGQLTRAMRVKPSGLSRIAGARLRPFGGYALLGRPQHPFTDRVVPMQELDAPLAAHLLDRVATLPADHDLVTALDAALAPAAAAAGAREISLAPIVDLAITRRGLVRVSDLAAAAGVGPRQLERTFQTQVGLSPKIFLRILRFQEVLNAVRRPAGADGASGDEDRHEQDVRSWADLALAHGFYDQAHFIRDFKGFVGESPTAWNVDASSLAALFSALRRGGAIGDTRAQNSNSTPADGTRGIRRSK